MKCKKIGAVLKSFGVILLLTFYAFANLPAGLLPEYFHGHHAHVAHTPDAEKDPCHRAIYHNDKHCGHKTHLSGIEKCNLCQRVHHNDQVIPSAVAEVFHADHVAPESRSIGSSFTTPATQLPSRAPPLSQTIR